MTTIRIGVTTTRGGKKGFALRTYNEHSKAWQWAGVVYTGPQRWAQVQRARAEVMAGLNEMSGKREQS